MIRIATRKSKLALWQASWVKAQLEALGESASLVEIETQGDKDMRSFAHIQGVGFFTKAVQEAILDGRADMAVHSFKDLPSAPHPELEIAAMSSREDPRDVLILHPDCWRGEQEHIDDYADKGLEQLKEAAHIGTSAVRRQRQLAALRPDLRLSDCRGNVPSRLAKLAKGDYDGIVLAAAGIKRLELDLGDWVLLYMHSELLLPAPAQGVLALECHRSNYQLAQRLTDLNDMPSYKLVAAERGLMAMLQGGCQLALGAHASHEEDGSIALSAWYEGRKVRSRHRSSEGAAMLAYQELGYPAHS